jgi:hypothetical protein
LVGLWSHSTALLGIIKADIILTLNLSKNNIEKELLKLKTYIRFRENIKYIENINFQVLLLKICFICLLFIVENWKLLEN